MSEWISVKERLPAPMRYVLVHYSYRNLMGISYVAFNGRFIDDGSVFGNVTHWMPLPEPPEEV